jgi:hypothetical protein
MTTEPIFITIKSADEPVGLDEVAQWIESDRKWINGMTETGTEHRLEMMGDAAEALIVELRQTRRRLAKSDERNDNLFELANKHLDTIDRVKALTEELQKSSRGAESNIGDMIARAIKGSE